MNHSDQLRTPDHASKASGFIGTINSVPHAEDPERARDLVPCDLTPEAVAHLTTAGGPPCVSVLMPTTPAPRMRIEDCVRLDELLGVAEQRLDDGASTEHERSAHRRLVHELRRQARIAQDSMTENALGLFVSAHVSHAWTLSVTVREKVVVEPTFATRDLLRALHRTPPHLVLRVDEFGARVFWVAARVMLLETIERLPVHSPRTVAGSGLAGSALAGSGALPDLGVASLADDVAEDRGDLLARIDACMTRIRAERPAPLVLAGDEALVKEVRASAGWLHRLAGEVVGPRADAPAQLFDAAALCVEDYLYRRGQQSLIALYEATATDPERVVAGLEQCWEAVTDQTPGTLVVEHGYVHPHPPGEGERAASHDLIDDLLEHAINAGNLIAFVDDAQLHEFAGVAFLRSS